MLRRWRRKFGFALRGLVQGARGQDSFAIHYPCAIAVLLLAWLFKLERWQWCVLVLCIAMVLVAEYVNSAIETLVRKLHPEKDDDIAKALDTSAAAVLLASLGAATIGLAILGPPMLDLLSQLLQR